MNYIHLSLSPQFLWCSSVSVIVSQKNPKRNNVVQYGSRNARSEICALDLSDTNVHSNLPNTTRIICQASKQAHTYCGTHAVTSPHHPPAPAQHTRSVPYLHPGNQCAQYSQRGGTASSLHNEWAENEACICLEVLRTPPHTDSAKHAGGCILHSGSPLSPLNLFTFI